LDFQRRLPVNAGRKFGRVRIDRAFAALLPLICLSLAACGGISNSAANSPAKPVNLTIWVSPRIAALTISQTQQFQATVKNGGSNEVTWSVDGIAGGNPEVGTISANGLYQPPSTAGVHGVTATSVADPTKGASVSVAVTDFAGTFTYHNDNARTGQNLQELALTPPTVNSLQFGKVFSYPVDGYTYAQPLYVADLPIPGQGVHNVVFVATEHDSVYAFDADGRSNFPLWQTRFLAPGVTTVSSDDVNSTDIVPEVGITGTPVIDSQSSTLFVIAKTKENGTNFVQHLHALDITTGNEKPGSPVAIQASVPGTGDGGDGHGNVTFDALRENQRAALLLQNGIVYIAFASHGDNDPYHGWVLGYDAQTLQQIAVYNDTPNGSRGGIWQSGGGPSADIAGNIYLAAGNGTFDEDSGGADFGNSFLKFSAGPGGLTLIDFFTPFNQADLSASDLDVGSSASVVLPDQQGSPHPHLLLVGGKDGLLYLLDRDNLGKFNPQDNSQTVQYLFVSAGGIFSTPAVWGNSIYVLATKDVLKAFQLNGGTLSLTSSSPGSTLFLFPGATPAVSAKGSSNGIVWLIDSSVFSGSSPAILHAYDATDVSRELYSSDPNGGGNAAGPAVKFTVPTVANGKVYVGTQNELSVFAQLP
jgi:hypothetical protein